MRALSLQTMKKVYVEPKVELLEARVEKGFAGSGTGNNPGDLEPVPEDPNNNDISDDFGK